MNGSIECIVDENDCGDLSRRQFLGQTIGGVTAAVAVAGAGVRVASAAGNAQRMPSFATDHAPQPLPFDASSLRGLSQRIIESHWANNYGGSVKALNEINRRLSQALAEPDLPAYVYNDLKREHLMRTGSVVLHELYFGNLGGSGKAGSDISAALASAFGDFNRWETEFRRIAAGLGGGSGWVMLGFNRQFGTLENYWMADHLHCPVATEPLLVLDMYEHSYHMDFGAAAARYIDAFFDNINWEAVSARLESL
ncbi:MAG: superoxide dismutase [Gammaproteobacteria bacterium]|nr:superoxide dismutase [Gammaproteobacteria bacterium]